MEIAADVAVRAGVAAESPPSPADQARVETLVAELPEAFAQFLAHGQLTPGRYEYANPLLDLEFATEGLPEEIGSLARDQTVHFDLADHHLALLRAARWRGLWMNAKRPYGDMTYFELDMADILGEAVVRDAEGRLPASQEKRLWRLHAETLPALQIYLRHAAIDLGDYPHIPVESGSGLY